MTQSKEILLWSDFHDYYDYQFVSRYSSLETLVLDRNMRNQKISRKQMLEFGNKNFDEVPYGYRKSDLDYSNKEMPVWLVAECPVMVVEHLDEYSHAGEGKRLVTLEEAGEDTLKVQYLGRDIGDGSESVRHLYIGNHEFVLRYLNDSDWRSNGPGCRIYLETVNPNRRLQDAPRWTDGEFLKEYPLLAFDFIKLPDYTCDDCYHHYLLDINTSPSWKGTFLEEMLYPAVVYEWIKEYMNAQSL